MSTNAAGVGNAFTWKRGGFRRSLPFGVASLAVIGVVALTLGALTTVDAQAAAPKTLYVSQTGLDSGKCTSTSPCATVSYALTKAPSGATIEVSGTIDDHPIISSPVTITTWAGGPAGSPAVLDGTASGTVVTVGQGVVGVTLDDLSIENGGGNTQAGGIYNQGTLKLTDSTISGNSAEDGGGGGVNNSINSTMTIIDSTISGNTARNGGGIFSQGTMTIIASTISGNTATGSGAGIYGLGGTTYGGGTVTLAATIVAANTGGNCYAASPNSLDSAGYNLTSDTTGTACGFNASHDLVNKNPLLGSLANNGGPTPTMLPALTSPAADVIPNPTKLIGHTVCPGTDQRGIARPGIGETRCTIGSVEVGSTIPTTTSVTLIPTTVTVGTRVVFLVTVTPGVGTGTPTGKISFTTGKKTLCKAVLSGGVAACGATTAPVGVDTVTGTYLGGGGFAGSSGAATLTVTNS